MQLEGLYKKEGVLPYRIFWDVLPGFGDALRDVIEFCKKHPRTDGSAGYFSMPNYLGLRWDAPGESDAARKEWVEQQVISTGWNPSYSDRED